MRDTSATNRVLVVVPEIILQGYTLGKMLGSPRTLPKLTPADRLEFLQPSRPKKSPKKSNAAKSRTWEVNNAARVKRAYYKRKIARYKTLLLDKKLPKSRRGLFEIRLAETIKKLKGILVEMRITKQI
jgi:ribosomal protein L29